MLLTRFGPPSSVPAVFTRSAEKALSRPGGEGWHYLGVILLALAVGLAFLQAPGFGDEFTYWSLAFNLHRIGGHAWSVASYHDLRWPVWGPSWVWQGLFGPGLASFYVVPLFYLSAGAVVAFALGRRLFGSVEAGWLSAGALVFEPLLDGVVARGMPDLTEAVLGGCVILAWWAAMRAERRAAVVSFAGLAGLSLGLAFSNRPTGLFMAPVLGLATLWVYPRQWPRLLIIAAAAAFFLAECAVYHAICGDALHSLHANLGNRGAKGTDPLAWWQFPFRYLPAFTHGNRLGWVFSAAALGGFVPLWRRGEGGKVVVLWFAGLFVLVSCTVQQLHPLRPLTGSAGRYLSMLAVPMALLIAAGVLELARLARQIRWRPAANAFAFLRRHRLLAGAAALALVGVTTGRPRLDFGYLPALREHLGALAPGTRIFTHREMRNLAWLADPVRTSALTWVVADHPASGGPALEETAAGCTQWWYLRKHLWLSARKGLEAGSGARAQPALPSWLETPERDWVLTQALAADAEPELVFYRRRQAEDPPARILEPAAPALAEIAPPLPWVWERSATRRIDLPRWNIPAEMRGKVVSIRLGGRSETVEPFDLKLRFKGRDKGRSEYLFKPIFYAEGGEDFLALRCPPNAEACEASLYPGRNTKAFTISAFRMVYDLRP